MARFLRQLRHQPENILVARTDRIGDFVLTLPVLEALKSEYKLNFTVLCQEAVRPLLENNPFVDKAIAINPATDSHVEEIRSNNFDCLLVLVNDPVMLKLISRLQFIPVRIGPLSKPSVLFKYTHPVIQKRSRSVMNEAEYNLELLEIFGRKNFVPSRPKLYLPKSELVQLGLILAEKLNLAQLPPDFAILHQGMGGSALNWKENNYQRILEKILLEGFVVMLSGTGDTESRQNQILMEEYANQFPGQLFDLSAQLSLREFMVLVRLAFVFMGPSTGPTHLANAVGTDIITFYSPIQVQTEIRWGPFKGEASVFTPKVDCGQKFKCIGEKCPHFYCMDQLKVDTVFETFLEIAQKNRQDRANS